MKKLIVGSVATLLALQLFTTTIAQRSEKAKEEILREAGRRVRMGVFVYTDELPSYLFLSGIEA